MPQTQSNYITSVIIGGRDVGWFTSFSGGGVSGETVPDRAPGQEYPTQSGGDKTLDPITLGRAVDPARDTDELEDFFASMVQSTDQVTIQRKKLINKVPFGKGTTWIGTLTAVNPTDSDNNSASERTNFEIVVAPSRRS
jgi:hypothetical protein